MTAFDHTLIAISLAGGRYTVSSQVDAHLDSDALERDGLLHDVSENSSYIDKAAILQKKNVPKYFLPESNHRRSGAVAWFNVLPEDAFLVVYHMAQFESGLG